MCVSRGKGSKRNGHAAGGLYGGRALVAGKRLKGACEWCGGRRWWGWWFVCVCGGGGLYKRPASQSGLSGGGPRPAAARSVRGARGRECQGQGVGGGRKGGAGRSSRQRKTAMRRPEVLVRGARARAQGPAECLARPAAGRQTREKRGRSAAGALKIGSGSDARAVAEQIVERREQVLVGHQQVAARRQRERVDAGRRAAAVGLSLL